LTGRNLLTRRDAAQYIIKLPKAGGLLPQWETAIECLMLIGEHGGAPTTNVAYSTTLSLAPNTTAL
jgi:hypothetical protein